MAQHDDVLIALRRIMRATDLYSHRLNRESGLTSPQLLILQSIERDGHPTVSDIANDVSLSQATVSTILDRLEGRGLVRRQRGTVDKRKVHALLTPQGAQLLESAPTPLQDTFILRFNELKDWEQSLIVSSVQRIAVMMDADHIDASPVLDVAAIERTHRAADVLPLPTPASSKTHEKIPPKPSGARDHS